MTLCEAYRQLQNDLKSCASAAAGDEVRQVLVALQLPTVMKRLFRYIAGCATSYRCETSSSVPTAGTCTGTITV